MSSKRTNPAGIPDRQAWEEVKHIQIDNAEKDTLVALVERGPLWDGDLPSKSARDSLLDRGYVVRVVVKGEDGWQAATYTGRDAYKALFPGPDGPAETIKQARINRITRRTIRMAARR